MAQTLKPSDAQAIKDFLPYVDKVVPVIDGSYQAKYRDNVMGIKLRGAKEEIKDVQNLVLQDGYFYSEQEETIGLKKCVVGYKVWETVFNKKMAFGKTILIQNIPFEVIGVLAPKGTDLAGEELDSVIYIPLKTMMRRFLDVDWISSILVTAKEKANILELKKEMTLLLRKRHNLGPIEKDDFNIFALEEIAKTKMQGIKLVSLLSKMAAIISFSIGGLGIFAVMLLSVAERQKEIGMRRAVGATKKDILGQFLGEAVFISFIGGFLGIIFGFLIALLVISVSNLPLAFSLTFVSLAFIISLGLGIIAGGYPAFLAASLPPLNSFKQ
jgi:putative ABC transport system permease protein